MPSEQSLPSESVVRRVRRFKIAFGVLGVALLLASPLLGVYIADTSTLTTSSDTADDADFREVVDRLESEPTPEPQESARSHFPLLVRVLVSQVYVAGPFVTFLGGLASLAVAAAFWDIEREIAYAE